MFNHALACSVPIINKLQPFLESEKGIAVGSDFREAVVADFLIFERDITSRGLNTQKIEYLKYVLAAFVDEIILNSDWPEKLSWMRRSLQLQFFGEHSAGEGFFARLNQLRQAGIAELDILEIYTLCLQLGFQGVYRFKDKIQLTTLITSLESQIEFSRGKQDLRLILSCSEGSDCVEKKRREIPLGWVVLATLASCFFIYAGYSIATHFQLHHAALQLSSESSYDG